MSSNPKKTQSKFAKPSTPELAVKSERTPALIDLFSKNNWIAYAVMAILAFGIYYSTVGFDYVLDDTMVIKDNKFTKKGFGGIWDHLTNESMTGYFGEQKQLLQGNRYRPLSMVTFAMERGVVGSLKPGPSHFINILLYIFNAILIFLLVRLLAKPEKSPIHAWSDSAQYCVALLSSLFFIAHPLHVEAVANIKGRDEIMALIFSIWSCYYFVKYVMTEQRKQAIIGSVLFLLALLSKENSITFLAVVPLTIFVFNGGRQWKPLLYMSLTTLFYLVLRFSVSGVPQLGVQSNDLMNNPFLDMHAGERLATILYTLGLYVKLLFYPSVLTHDYYPYTIPIMDFGKWQVWLSFLAYVAIASLGIANLHKRNLLSYSILFYLITLTIVSNLVINLGAFMGDRFLYMPSVGFAILTAYGVYWLSQKIFYANKNLLMYGLGALIILPYVYRSVTRVPDWKNGLSLNRSAFPASAGSARVNSFMATALFNEFQAVKANTSSADNVKLLKEGLPYAYKSIEIYPKYHNGHLMVAGLAGEIYAIDRKLPPLLDAFYTSATVRPDINAENAPDGKLTSHLTKYLDYLNSSERGNPDLLNWYIKTVDKMSESPDRNLVAWGQRIGELGISTFPSDSRLAAVVNKINNKFKNPMIAK